MSFKSLSHRFDDVALFLRKIGVANVFYSHEWFRFLQNAGAGRPSVFGVVDEDDSIQAVIVFVLEENYFWPLSLLTTRAVVHGGPYVHGNNTQVLDTLLQHFNKLVKGKAIFSQFRNDCDMKWAIPVFQKHGFVYEAHLNILIDLHQPKEVMLKNISRNKRRNVTKSINKGSEVEIIQTKEVYLQSLDLIYTTYNRIGLPLVARSYFIQAFEQLHPQGILKPFALFKDGQCIGVRLELVYEGVIYDWFAGSSDQYKNHYPNDVLPYSILDWGSDEKCSEFNFGGAGKPDVEYGVREHKLKFGGELVEFGRFEKVNNRFLFQIGKMGLNLVKKIKNKR